MSTAALDQKRLDTKQHRCLTEAIYFEAGNQDLKGKIAVANVIVNRAKHHKKDVCWVINRPKQFSYKQMRAFKRQQIDMRNPDTRAAMNGASSVSYRVLRGKVKDVTMGARFYINPAYATDFSWSKVFVKTVKIGDHVFYRDPKAVSMI